MTEVAVVTEADIEELLPLMRGYCDFYETATPDGDLLGIARALIADPREGVQYLARVDGRGAGFATVYWSWSTLRGGRIGVMNDLFVDPSARGRRVGEALIAACLGAVRARGAKHLTWQTALDNHTAQALYDRIGGSRAQWLDYSLEP